MTKDIKDKPDSLNVKVAGNRQTEQFKRPDHTDFMDASELKKAEFSGYRQNQISHDCEIWLLGEMKASISPAQLQANPMAVNEAMEDIFMLDKVMPNTAVAVAYEAIQQRKEEQASIVLPFNSKLKH